MARTILIVDDVNVNREILKRILGGEYETVEASNGEDALSILDRSYEAISAVLLDIAMPGMDGYEVLRRIRSLPVPSSMPIIMITDSEDNESRVKCLSLGANDYVIKPYSPEIMKRCLRNNIAFHEAEATVSALQRDKLTQRYSREPFFDIIQEMVSSHAPGYYMMSCFDIEKFKIINDQYGTQKGDEVLRHTAEVFQEGFVPNGGICCRIAVDSFPVLHPASFKGSNEFAAIREKSAHVEGIVSPIQFTVGRYYGRYE